VFEGASYIYPKRDYPKTVFPSSVYLKLINPFELLWYIVIGWADTMLNRLSVKSVQPSFYSSSRIDSILTPSDRTSIYLSFVHVILVLSFVFYILGSTDVLSFFSNNPASS
jgi:hypothetical protein